MPARALSLQTPDSLAGTLAAYKTRKRSLQEVSTVQDTSKAPRRVSLQPDAESVYQFALPSLHFLRWRPLYHVQAPSGWMNDPCAPSYDPSTRLYHVFFQWNPRRNASGAVSWGTIQWGHASSKDMINWNVSGTAAIKPDSWYDREGCFTGCLVPTGPEGQPGQMTILYTGVSQLPLHYTLPYVQGTETLAIACSSGAGNAWSKPQGNPVLSGSPDGYSVTGWRDPFVAEWPSMDKLLGRDDSETFYGLISGGLRGQTPAAFLYSINKSNLAEWTYLGQLVELGLNHSISRWSGDMGINWECATFVTLRNGDEGTSRDFIIVGGEGSDTSHPESTFAQHPQESTKFPRHERSLQWMCGDLRMVRGEDDKDAPRMEYSFGGRFDHGALYAVNSFFDPESSSHVAWGWITEEDLPQKLVDRQNWSGMLSIPRELSLISLKGVAGACKSDLKDISSIEANPEPGGTFTVQTLGMAPARSLQGLRKGAREIPVRGGPELTEKGDCFLDIHTLRFELIARLSVSNSCKRIGMSIFHNEEHEIASSSMIYFVPDTETLTVARPNSSEIDPNIHTFPELAPFTLFSLKTEQGQDREKLVLHVFFDESVLEVFANSRCTFATRVYPATKRCWGVRFWAEDCEGLSRLDEVQAWDGLRADIKVT